MKINDIVAYTQCIAPYESAEDWDNVGLLAGSPDEEVCRVLLALDITADVIEEAHEKGASMIISHHPVIFEPLRALSPDEPAYLLAKYGIAALCLHTNLDRAEQGVNTALGAALGLNNTRLFPEDFILTGEPDKEYDAAGYAEVIKERLNAPSVRFTQGKVSRVAVSSGGGGEGVMLAEKYGCDAFISGELKHHHYLYAVQHGIAAFDAGHFSTENIIIKPLKDMLAGRFPDTGFIISERSKCPYKAI
nr:Nif3-like dinuclear metal center hexameric protein [uncultured Ruminococcus sp.]